MNATVVSVEAPGLELKASNDELALTVDFTRSLGYPHLARRQHYRRQDVRHGGRPRQSSGAEPSRNDSIRASVPDYAPGTDLRLATIPVPDMNSLS
jgi:hypothetical protein